MKKKVLLIITTLVVTSIVTVKTGLTSKACQICEEAIAAGLDATHIDEDAPATDQAVEEATNEETTELVNPDNVLIPEGTDDESIDEFLNSLLDGTTTEGEETVQGETPSTESDITDGLQTTDEPIIGEDGTVESDETVTTPIPEEEVVMPEIGDSVPSDTESATNPGMEDTGAPDTESSVVNPPIDPEFSQPSQTLQPERPEFDKEENKENEEDKKEENKENEEDKKEDTGNKENVEDKKEETENKETTEDKKEDTTLPSTPVKPTISIILELKV
jgi:hypothetical protein